MHAQHRFRRMQSLKKKIIKALRAWNPRRTVLFNGVTNESVTNWIPFVMMRMNNYAGDNLQRDQIPKNSMYLAKTNFLHSRPNKNQMIKDLCKFKVCSSKIYDMFKLIQSDSQFSPGMTKKQFCYFNDSGTLPLVPPEEVWEHWRPWKSGRYRPLFMIAQPPNFIFILIFHLKNCFRYLYIFSYYRLKFLSVNTIAQDFQKRTVIYEANHNC